jgi:arsenite-transporting ATPase
LPHDSVFDAVTRLHAELGAVRSVLTDPMTSSIRLVLTPEAVVLAEARRTLTTLSLYGYRVDGVIANRVFPSGGDDAWRAGWVAAQNAVLAEVDESFAGLPVYRSPYRAGEPIGLEELSAFAAEAYGDADVFGLPDATEQVTVEREGNARFTLVLSLPLADKRDLQLSRRGDELVVTVGAHRRVLSLPSVLRRCSVEDAELVDGTLRVAFVPDLEQWMST